MKVFVNYTGGKGCYWELSPEEQKSKLLFRIPIGLWEYCNGNDGRVTKKVFHINQYTYR